MAGQIVKAKVKRDYVQLKNKVAQDNSLSWQALGLLTYILSLPDDWTIRKMQMYSLRKSNGRTSTESAFNELIEKKFIYSVDKRDVNGQFIGCDYIVYNEPPIAENPQAENPQADKPIAENQHLQKKYLTKETDYKENRGQSYPTFFVDIPSEFEVQSYFKEQGRGDIESMKFFKYQRSRGWRGIENWRAAADYWILGNQEKEPASQNWVNQ